MVTSCCFFLYWKKLTVIRSCKTVMSFKTPHYICSGLNQYKWHVEKKKELCYGNKGHFKLWHFHRESLVVHFYISHETQEVATSGWFFFFFLNNNIKYIVALCWPHLFSKCFVSNLLLCATDLPVISNSVQLTIRSCKTQKS